MSLEKPLQEEGQGHGSIGEGQGSPSDVKDSGFSTYDI
jgi:hypothetical protein